MRWMLLLGTLALWLACMLAVNAAYRTHESVESVPGTEDTLNAMFDEQIRAPKANKWKIFIDPVRMKENKLLAAFSGGSAHTGEPLPPWDGKDEFLLLEVGELLTNEKPKGTTRLEQTTEVTIKVPFLEKTEFYYKTWSDIGIERGLETFSSTFTLKSATPKISLEFNCLGEREADALTWKQIFTQDGKQVSQQNRSISVKGKAVPNLQLIPFQENAKVKAGYTLNIVMFDLSVAPAALLDPNAAGSKLVTMKAICSGPKQILHNGKTVSVFEARTEDGRARAWYSADGIVLKQDFVFAGLLEVMLIKADPKELHRR